MVLRELGLSGTGEPTKYSAAFMMREAGMGMALIMRWGILRVELSGLVLGEHAYHGYLLKALRVTTMKHIFRL